MVDFQIGRIAFPVTTITTPTPGSDGLCPICGERRVGEPHSMVVLNGGALRREADGSCIIANDLAGFFNIRWHGAHREDGGEGPYPDAVASVDLVSGSPIGQWDWYVCSPHCLRILFSRIVDEFEKRLMEGQDG